MGDVTYLLPTQPTLPFSPVPLASSRPPSLGKRRRRSTVGCAALFLRSIHLRRNIESQEFIHAAVAVAAAAAAAMAAAVVPPASQLPGARQTDRGWR